MKIEIKVDSETGHIFPILYKNELWEYLDTGNTRCVFTNKDKTMVLKMLIGNHSVDYNKKEIDIYENANQKTKSKMAVTNFENGFIIQEFVEKIKDYSKLTIPQMLFAQNCRKEVGFTKNGKLVCYDLDEYLKY